MSQSAQDNKPIPNSNDPFTTIEQWLIEAAATEPNNPDAMSVATVDETGLPNIRTLLMKGLDGPNTPLRGLVFYTNFESTKGHELIANPKAALLFHWKSLGRQIRIRGTVTTVADKEADAYFVSRPTASRIGAWASDQSRPLDTRKTLDDRMAEYERKFANSDVPRPKHWSGFRLTPLQIEFWQNGADRLHERLLYSRTDISDPWTTQHLYP